jgi:hypothetical protein
MTTPDEPHSPVPTTELQFDHAEFSTPAATALSCKGCNQPIPESYYEVNGIILCDGCRATVESRFLGGSGAARFLRACVFGVGAALAGSALYYLIAALTGYSWAIIAIVVGLMVGSAVRAGSRHRGGWPYQALAIFLTYTAIVSSYIPFIWAALSQEFEEPEKVAAAPVDPAKPATKAGRAEPAATKPAERSKPEAAPGRAKQPVAAAPAQPEAPQPAVKPAKRPGAAPQKLNLGPALLALMLLLVMLMAFAYAAPFLAGAQNLIGLLIIFFGLHQAWRLNRKMTLVVNGPFLVGDVGPAPQEVAGHE